MIMEIERSEPIYAKNVFGSQSQGYLIKAQYKLNSSELLTIKS